VDFFTCDYNSRPLAETPSAGSADYWLKKELDGTLEDEAFSAALEEDDAYINDILNINEDELDFTSDF
jgi:hypothetical protein